MRATLAEGKYTFDLLMQQATQCADGRVLDVFARYVFGEDGANGSIAPVDGVNPCGGAPIKPETFILTPAPA